VGDLLAEPVVVVGVGLDSAQLEPDRVVVRDLGEQLG
jgi:hypothetical protein